MEMTDKDILISDLNDISEILINNGYGGWYATIRKAVDLLKEQEAVEPKTGYWIYKKYDDMFMCSSCEKYSIRNDYPYCHWCGAKMKQEGR